MHLAPTRKAVLQSTTITHPLNSLYIAALITGLAGSLHCLGMCGPLMAGIGAGHQRWQTLGRQMLLHQPGRWLGYMLFGALFGAFGQAAALILLQRWLMMIAGGLILITLFVTLKPVSGKVFTSGLNRAMAFLGVGAGSHAGMFLLGVANGLLPCGLVYAAAAGAMATGTWHEGALYMLLFGMANTPVLLLASAWRRIAPASLALRSRFWRTVPLAVIAVFFILKGAGLGIPYISPAFAEETHKPACCRPK